MVFEIWRCWIELHFMHRHNSPPAGLAWNFKTPIHRAMNNFQGGVTNTSIKALHLYNNITLSLNISPCNNMFTLFDFVTSFYISLFRFFFVVLIVRVCLSLYISECVSLCVSVWLCVFLCVNLSDFVCVKSVLWENLCVCDCVWMPRTLCFLCCFVSFCVCVCVGDCIYVYGCELVCLVFLCVTECVSISVGVGS